MCGIAGFLGLQPPDEGRVKQTLSLMRQRGPDGLGRFENSLGENRLLLLHSRLAIIDLNTRSDQPFVSDHCALIFNGEIYNYLELADILKQKGHQFTTDSDTEVIIKAYLEWGEDLVDHLQGMWALALFDSRRQKLILSRDPFGEKPLYTWETKDGLYFGSEVKFIKALSGDFPAINHDKVRRYLAYGYRDVYKNSDSFFHGIQAVPAAGQQVLTADGRGPVRRYWQPRFEPRNMTSDEAVSGVRDRLFDAIKIRLRADVPLALTLSGGIDSNVIAGIAVKHFGQPLHTFSMLEDDADYDERSFIHAAVESLGTPHYECPVEKSGFLERLGRMAHHYEAPVLTVGMFLEGFLAETVAEKNFKLSINGNGSDEIFAGYYDHYLYWLASLHGTSDWEPEVERWQHSMGQFVRNPLFKDPARFVKTPNERRHLHLNAPDVEAFMKDPIDPGFSEIAHTDAVLRNRMLNELTAESVPVTLFCGDLNWMNYSIENRTAFLDRDLVDFVYSIPSNLLIQQGYSKYLLRQAARGYVPSKILFSKQKFGFNAPITSLLDRSDPDVREFMMMESPVFDLVHRDKVEALMREDAPIEGRDNFLFCLASAKMFYATQKDGG